MILTRPSSGQPEKMMLARAKCPTPLLIWLLVISATSSSFCPRHQVAWAQETSDTSCQPVDEQARDPVIISKSSYHQDLVQKGANQGGDDDDDDYSGRLALDQKGNVAPTSDNNHCLSPLTTAGGGGGGKLASDGDSARDYMAHRDHGHHHHHHHLDQQQHQRLLAELSGGGGGKTGCVGGHRNTTSMTSVGEQIVGQQNDHPFVKPGQRLEDPDCSWRIKYIDEQGVSSRKMKFRPMIVERSIDERLANTIYTVSAGRIINLDQFKFWSGDQRQDASNMLRLANDDSQRCGQHLDGMLRLMEDLEERLKLKRMDLVDELALNESHIHLARVLDSFGRYESGYFLGKTYSFGSYEQCSGASLQLNDGGGDDDDDGSNNNNNHNGPKPNLVDTRYCWAQLAIDKYLDPRLKSRKLVEFETLDSNLNVGICIPKSCNTVSFERHRKSLQKLINSQFKLPQSMYLNEHLEIKSLYCPLGDTMGIPLSGKLFLLFVASWFGLMLYVTRNSSRIASQWSPKLASLAQCLDLSESWQDFIGANDQEREQRRRLAGSKVELNALNLIKVIGCAYVVFGHSYVFSLGRIVDTLLVYDLAQNDPLLLAMMVGTVVVDTFFVITGILLAFVAMKRARPKRLEVGPNGQQQQQQQQHQQIREVGGDGGGESATTTTMIMGQAGKQTSNQFVYFMKSWCKFSLNRYLRLTPLLTLVFWFKKGVFTNMMNGLPFWDDGMNPGTVLGACKDESWLSPVLALQAFLPMNQQCLAQAWSVSTDIFFGLTVAPIILIMTRRPKVAAFMALALGAFSSGWAWYSFENLDPRLGTSLKDMTTPGFALLFGQLSFLYTYPHYKISSVLVGVLFGYLLFKYDESEDLKDWPQWLKGPATKAAAVIVVAVFVFATQIPLLKAALKPYHQQVVVHMMTTLRVIWSLACGVLLLRMASDWRHKAWVRMSSSKIMAIWVKLNFAILLVHIDYLILFMGTQTYSVTFSRLLIVNSFLSTYLFSFVVATLLHVVFENPIDKLIRRHILS